MLHTPEEAARIIGGDCTASWLREQARKRRISFVLIAGKYAFTEHHMVQIIEQYEVTPGSARSAAPRRTTAPTDSPVTTLQARRPRRARRSA